MLQERYLFEDRDYPVLRPESSTAFSVDSHGSSLFGRILLPAQTAKDERTPVLLQLHGFPGFEQNLDLPQALRRAGIATAYFSYRGVWGSHGYYSFSHLIEDVFSVVDHLTGHAEEYRIDPDRIYLLGHSMGGFAGLNAIARGLPIRGAIFMAPCDLGYVSEEDPEYLATLLSRQKSGYFSVPSEDWLAQDVAAHAHEWRFLRLTDRLPSHLPIHFIGGTQDVGCSTDLHISPLYQRLLADGRPTSYTPIEDGHVFPATRIALTRTIFRLICEMEQH